MITLFLFSSKLGRLARRSPLGDERTAGLSLLGKSLGNKLLVGGSFFLVSKDTVHLFGLAGALALQGQGSDKTLDLGGLTDLLALLAGELAVDDVLANIVVLGQVEKLADIVGTLGTQTTGNGFVGQSLDGLFSDLGDYQVQDSDVLSYNASTDGLALAHTTATLAVARHTIFKKQTHASVLQDTLLHRETLLVVATRDAENVSRVLIAESVARNLGSDPLVVERTPVCPHARRGRLSAGGSTLGAD